MIIYVYIIYTYIYHTMALTTEAVSPAAVELLPEVKTARLAAARLRMALRGREPQPRGPGKSPDLGGNWWGYMGYIGYIHQKHWYQF